MKFNESLNNKLVAAMLLLTTIFASSGAYALSDDKVVTKARQSVEEAGPDDWQTYAKAAEMCIQKSVNMKEAAKWLDHSLEIKETPLNLRVKGDYYLKNRLPRKAINYYIKSMDAARKIDFYFDASDLQRRIAKAKKMQKKLV
ncbi:hypothetical protein QQ008_05365 [Fulvivirgaceae bacterium BMA10]|uniref:Tetratricopeptide repeat protein n=1 Tax=Splendidivirga corallicola TaxID=3051826 RepID=A0ABT8KKN7_9BACT|nr:hypothetical protein [Fulvivirgaceae bacterium BMA10]